METRAMTKTDFDAIVGVIDRWWGGAPGTFAEPVFFHELGENALVVEDKGEIVGFLLGFIVPRPVPSGYVQLVGIDPDYRRRGVGRLLYERFTEVCRAQQCERLKAITTAGNEGSLRFHLALGFLAQEVEDYAGPGRKRVVFTKSLGQSLVPPNEGSAQSGPGGGEVQS
ncbi:MAG: GNAT family N-acetyltransferase [Polyangiaceae bacterium]